MLDSNFINEWLPKQEIKNSLFTSSGKNENRVISEDNKNIHGTKKVISDIESITKKIEEAQIDITTPYPNWVKVGLSLANELGEGGRPYFHRISGMFPRYSQSECDKQYDVSIKENGKGVTIKSFFYMAELAGVDINHEPKAGKIGSGLSLSEEATAYNQGDEPTPGKESGESDTDKQETTNSEHDSLIFDTPPLPDLVFENLPVFLRESCNLFRDGLERDIFLVSAISVLSACLPNIEGYYFNKALAPNLYLFVTGPAASGKSGMDWARYLGQTIHDQYIEQSKKEREVYDIELDIYSNLQRKQKQKPDRPKEPDRKLFFIPANSSSSALIQILYENDSRGIIFESESDSMAQTAKNEWGVSSDIYRKSFHHEPVSLCRRKEKEYMEVKRPKLSIVMSGTPKQLLSILPEVENGLFSRYLYYAFEDLGGFNSPFESHADQNYPKYFKQKGKEIAELYGQLQNLKQSIIFQLTMEQEKRFTLTFNHMLQKDRLLIGRDFDANVKRLGIILFRVTMILSALRILEDGELSSPMVCSDQDFETALIIVTTLEKHAIAVFHRMPKNELKGKMSAFYDKLPLQFNRQGYLKVAGELGINTKMAEYYIAKFIPKLLKHAYNQYTKISI